MASDLAMARAGALEMANRFKTEGNDSLRHERFWSPIVSRMDTLRLVLVVVRGIDQFFAVIIKAMNTLLKRGWQWHVQVTTGQLQK